jgi:hypothetical protein
VDTTVHPALWPNAEDARARRLVRLPDGRVARLAFVRHGSAKVVLPSGRWLRKSVCDLALLPAAEQTPPPKEGS